MQWSVAGLEKRWQVGNCLLFSLLRVVRGDKRRKRKRTSAKSKIYRGYFTLVIRVYFISSPLQIVLTLCRYCKRGVSYCSTPYLLFSYFILDYFWVKEMALNNSIHTVKKCFFSVSCISFFLFSRTGTQAAFYDTSYVFT